MLRYGFWGKAEMSSLITQYEISVGNLRLMRGSAEEGHLVKSAHQHGCQEVRRRLLLRTVLLGFHAEGEAAEGLITNKGSGQEGMKKRWCWPGCSRGR